MTNIRFPRRFAVPAAIAALAALAAPIGSALADDEALSSLQPGNPGLRSAGAIAFGPAGILFVGDTNAGAIVAIDTRDRPATRSSVPVRLERIDRKIAETLGVAPNEILINDMAVNPLSGQVYLSVSRGSGDDMVPAIARVNADGAVEALKLDDVRFAKVELKDANIRNRQEAITDLAYHDGKVYVAGLSNEDFASRFRSVPFPFLGADKGTSLEIYHGAHGRFETASPVRTFTTYRSGEEDYLLAAYTCTPLVKFPIREMRPGVHLKGVTIAELGNRNRPLDMIVYTKNGKEYILLANNARGVMRIEADRLAEAEAIVNRINGTAGLPYKTIEELKGVEQLDKFDDAHAVILARNENGEALLDTVPLP